MGMFSDLKKQDAAQQAQTTPRADAVVTTRVPVNPGIREPGNTASREPGNTGTREAGKPASRDTGQHATDPADRFDINRVPTEKETYLCTVEEVAALEDLKLELRRRYDLRVSKQDIERCGIQFLASDYQAHGEQSILVKRLKQKKR